MAAYITLDQIIHDAAARNLDGSAFCHYAQDHNLTLAALINTVALHIAKTFDAGAVPYPTADAAIDSVWSLMIDCGTLPDLAYHIYEAFDAGEFPRQDKDDPIERYTRPLIKKLIQIAAEHPPHAEGYDFDSTPV